MLTLPKLLLLDEFLGLPGSSAVKKYHCFIVVYAVDVQITLESVFIRFEVTVFSSSQRSVHTLNELDCIFVIAHNDIESYLSNRHEEITVNWVICAFCLCYVSHRLQFLHYYIH